MQPLILVDEDKLSSQPSFEIITANNKNALKITSFGTAAALKIAQNGNTSSSISAGGAVNIDNTNNTGAGLVLYSNQATPSGRLLIVNAANAGYNQSAVRVEHAGTGRGVDINQTGTGIGLNVAASGGATASQHAAAISLANTGSSTSSALSVTSANASHSAIQVTGVETGKGTIKIAHVGDAGGLDGNASAISIDLQTAGTAAQGIFMDATNGPTTGNLLEIRNNTANRLRLTAAGNLIILVPSSAPASTSPPMFNGSVTMWIDEAGNNLKFQVRYSGGGVKTGTLAVV